MRILKTNRNHELASAQRQSRDKWRVDPEQSGSQKQVKEPNQQTPGRARLTDAALTCVMIDLTRRKKWVRERKVDRNTLSRSLAIRQRNKMRT